MAIRFKNSFNITPYEKGDMERNYFHSKKKYYIMGTDEDLDDPVNIQSVEHLYNLMKSFLDLRLGRQYEKYKDRFLYNEYKVNICFYEVVDTYDNAEINDLVKIRYDLKQKRKLIYDRNLYAPKFFNRFKRLHQYRITLFEKTMLIPCENIDEEEEQTKPYYTDVCVIV